MWISFEYNNDSKLCLLTERESRLAHFSAYGATFALFSYFSANLTSDSCLVTTISYNF